MTRTRKDGKKDKRYGKKPDKPYCGKKRPANAKQAAFKIKLVDAIPNHDEYEAFCRCFLLREEIYHQYTQNENVTRAAVNIALLYDKGNFYTHLGNIIGKPWLSCKLKGNNAWYWHNDAERIHRTATSIAKNNILEMCCSQYGFNENKAADIQNRYHDITNEWRSQYEIKNRCHNQSHSTFPENDAYVLDYGTQAKYTISSNDWAELDNKTVSVSHTVYIGDETKRYSIDFKYNIPERIILMPTTIIDICKPSIFHDSEYCRHDIDRKVKNNEQVLASDDLVVSVPYWYIPADVTLGEGVFGIDAGILRIFRGGIVFPDGRYIENIDPSPEIVRRNVHIQVLKNNKDRLYDKWVRLDRLVKKSKVVDEKALRKCESIRLEYESVRSNYASERESLSWLVANEIVALAREFSCYCINIENLKWVGGSGQSWNYSQLFNCLSVVANRYGISVVRVSAYKSSQRDASTGKDLVNGVSSDRVAVWADGSCHDRDGNAALELACRGVGHSDGHVRSLSSAMDVGADCKRYSPVVRSRVHCDGKRVVGDGKRRWTSGGDSGGSSSVVRRSGVCDVGVSVDRSTFLASVRARRDEWLGVMRERSLNRDCIFSFAGSSGSVACLARCRSVVPSGVVGVPGVIDCLEQSAGKAQKPKPMTKHHKIG